MEISKREFALANARGASQKRGARVVSARFDAQRGHVVIAFQTGVELSFPAAATEGLAGAPEEKLQKIEVSPSGLGLHWPLLDADVYIPSLIQGVLGSKSWMAAQLGRAGGSARSQAKITAARENGRRGGRPAKRASS